MQWKGHMLGHMLVLVKNTSKTIKIQKNNYHFSKKKKKKKKKDFRKKNPSHEGHGL